MESKGVFFSIRFLNLFSQFFELKRYLDDSALKEVDYYGLFEEFEEKLINNMKLLSFKFFLKDSQSYSRWSKLLDQLKTENSEIPNQKEHLGSLWTRYQGKLLQSIDSIHPDPSLIKFFPTNSTTSLRKVTGSGHLNVNNPI